MSSLYLITSITLDPLHRMQSALDYKRQHPSESYSMVATRFNVAKSTLQDRHRGTHVARGEKGPRKLSMAQEDALIGSINTYAERGTLMTPKHVQQLAQRLCGTDLGVNWTSTFLRRHKDRVSSRFYKVQELSRLKANTPANRAAFLTLVGPSKRV